MGGERNVEGQTLSEEVVGGAHPRRKELISMGKEGETGALKIEEAVKVRARA